MITSINDWFENKREYSPVFIRLVVGAYLVYLQQSNVFSYENMIAVGEYFDGHNIPFPMISAYISAYAQFIAGILFLLGAFIRYAAVVMVINFIVAFIAVDIHKVYPQNFPAQVMLSSALFFLFYGAGKLSIDEWIKTRCKNDLVS
jgi:putative oxidoreductase